MSRDHYRLLLLALSLLVLLLMVASLLAGRANLGVTAAWHALLARDAGLTDIIIWQIRVPRTLLAALVGASLGLSGALLQGLLRNPLAEAGVIGVSSAAALAAVLVFYSGLAAAWPLGLPLGGMGGAFVAVLLVLALAGRSGDSITLILAGVVVSSLAGALTALTLNLSPNPYAAAEIIFWMMGSLADRSFDQLQLAALLSLPGWLLMLSCARGLDALALGEDAAATLGFNPLALRLRAVAGIALAVGAAVSVSGVIGFIGLVVPHLLRPLVAHRPGALLAVSALGGAALLLTTDIAVRLLPTHAELKIGVVTALFGAPFFLLLLWRIRRFECG